jgi:hypothetical protein
VRTSFLKRLVAVGGAFAVTFSGAVLLTAAPASAKTVVTDYGFHTFAYGTRIRSNTVALNAGRSAHSWIACTRYAGINGSNRPTAANFLTEAGTPAANPLIKLGAMETANRTYRNTSKHLVGTSSVSKLASVTLSGPDQGDTPGPVFRLEGLVSKSTVTATKGVFAAKSEVTSGKLTLDLPSIDPAVDSPLGQLVDALSGGIGAVIDTVAGAQGQEIEIPGLGVVKPGYEHTSIKKNMASASTHALVVQLYGQDGVRGTDDDSTISIGRSRARMLRDLPAGVMQGYGYGLDASAADGLLKIGETGIESLPCQGTGGDTLTSFNTKPAADLLQGMLSVGTMKGLVNGLQRQDGSGYAWTSGEVSRAVIGTGDQRVELDGIVGRANVKKSAAGKWVRSTKGTGIGSLTIGGQSFGADQLPSDPIVIDGLGTIEFNVTKMTKRGVRVTAVRVTLNPGDASQTVINLGNARAFFLPA